MQGDPTCTRRIQWLLHFYRNCTSELYLEAFEISNASVLKKRDVFFANEFPLGLLGISVSMELKFIFYIE